MNDASSLNTAPSSNKDLLNVSEYNNHKPILPTSLSTKYSTNKKPSESYYHHYDVRKQIIGDGKDGGIVLYSDLRARDRILEASIK